MGQGQNDVDKIQARSPKYRLEDYFAVIKLEKCEYMYSYDTLVYSTMIGITRLEMGLGRLMECSNETPLVG